MSVGIAIRQPAYDSGSPSPSLIGNGRLSMSRSSAFGPMPSALKIVAWTSGGEHGCDFGTAALLPPTVEAQVSDDQEFVASLALHHEITEVPIVDADRRFLGVVSSRQLMHVLRHEHVEDLRRLAGIKAETDQARHCLEEPPLRRAKDRLPWLLLGLLGSIGATAVMASFSSALHRRIEIAFFIPGLV